MSTAGSLDLIPAREWMRSTCTNVGENCVPYTGVALMWAHSPHQSITASTTLHFLLAQPISYQPPPPNIFLLSHHTLLVQRVQLRRKAQTLWTVCDSLRLTLPGSADTAGSFSGGESVQQCIQNCWHNLQNRFNRCGNCKCTSAPFSFWKT